MKLYNTEVREKVNFEPIKPPEVRLYTCGPTVYHYAHIGNFRTYVFEDLLRRTLKYFGYQVTQVMNLTDVDDKTIKGALAGKMTLDAYTKPFIDAFFEDKKTLGIEPAEHYPAATSYIPQMIEMIEKLLNKGVAYKGGDGSIYYAIRKFPRYGCLSHLHLDELQVGASDRVSADEYDKDHLSDFVLWKNYDPTRDGEIYWDSPYGKGRPGWHLECSAMAISILGETLDIHVGGVDNMFPHHENEIAQSEAYSGKQFVKHWMHSEHLLVDGRKMSKSLGNFYTLRNLLDKGFTGRQVRYILLQTHYRTQLNFTFAGLDAAKHSLQRLDDFIQRLKAMQGQEAMQGQGESGSADRILKQAELLFKDSLSDDLNISAALAALFDLVREINILCDANKLGKEQADKTLQLLKDFNRVLGFLQFDFEESIPNDLQEALERRNEARRAKNWALADTLRDEITNRGYIIEDTPAGARLKKLS